MRQFYSAPCLIDISITKRCNLCCEYCYASASPQIDSNEELTVEEFKDIFKQIDDLNVHRISLSGGEPFVRNDFFNILEEAVKYKFCTIINTNATLITDSIAKRLTKYNFDRICVTLDGSNAKTHDFYRGSGSFEKTLAGIKNLKKYNLPVSTLFTLNNNNIENLIDCIKFNEDLGIEYMSVMVLCPTGRASSKDLLVKKEQWYQVFMKLTDMKVNNEIKLKFKIVPPNEGDPFWLFYFPLKYYNKLDLLSVWNQEIPTENIERKISCQAGTKACSIDYNGDIYGCDLMIGLEEFLAGNLRQDTLKNIWDNSKVFNKLRNISFDQIEGKCKDCNNLWCGGGCRSSAYNLTGSIYGSDNVCFYNED